MDRTVLTDLLTGITGESAGAALDQFIQRRLDAGVPAGAVDEERRAASRVVELLTQRRERSRELSVLNAIAGRLAATSDLPNLLQQIVDQTRLLLRVDLAYLSLLAGNDVLHIEVTSGSVSASLEDVEHSVHRGLVAEAMRRGEPAVTADYLADGSFAHEADSDETMAAEGVRALIVAPLRAFDRPTGALFAAAREPREFGVAASELLTSLAAHAAIAIDNARSARDVHAANETLQRRSAELEQIVQWDSTLTEVVLRGGGVDDLVAEISSIVATPVTFRRAGALALGAESGHAIEAGGETLGYLEFEVPEAAARERRFLERAESALALACLAEAAAMEAGRRTKDATLIGLLTRSGPVDDGQFRQQARLAGLDPEARYAVLVSEAVVPDGHRSWLRGQLHAMDWPRGTVIAEFGERVLTIVPSVEPDSIAAQHPSAIAGSVTTAIGPAVPARRISESYAAAQQTLDVMVALGRLGNWGTSDELGLYRVLLDGTSRTQVQAIIEDALGALFHEQQRRNVPLVETVEAYLGNQQRHAPTARELNVHVNTLYQRLEVIDRILGPDWRGRDRSVDLQVALRLRASLGQVAKRHT
ncbi:DNA-binding PucR family transcriptional regulator [Mycolicibacterium sp. BK556]|uniref:helix-turn-helix domain-containing protein n=1 Tax=unclassified Mycolicibacterium TaxID=2636767 RepID=UPI001615DE96|nr:MULTISPECIES: helix-turn-helix domain-containing protein [unclassified Mycolicibacterium]MBB3607088.1 DNA-binding PucR family transcriptional regulator [Mycolicibacterium sp. BK556]MBB3636802.1 DNA-binding PucR family transcriptional regulator [Mycolicibacterium sp. BK607]